MTNTTVTATSASNHDSVSELARLKAENAKLREALFGSTGVTSGLAVLEKCLAKSVKADHSDAPFPLDANQARIWHSASAGAYQHALEMICIDPALNLLNAPALPIEDSEEPQATSGMTPN